MVLKRKKFQTDWNKKIREGLNMSLAALVNKLCKDSAGITVSGKGVVHRDPDSLRKIYSDQSGSIRSVVQKRKNIKVNRSALDDVDTEEKAAG